MAIKKLICRFRFEGHKSASFGLRSMNKKLEYEWEFEDNFLKQHRYPSQYSADSRTANLLNGRSPGLKYQKLIQKQLKRVFTAMIL